MRRLPVYLLLDTSGSMRGEPIAAVNNGLHVLVSALRQDPHALETVHIAILTFDVEVRVVVPLTPVDELLVPEILTPQSGATHLGLALGALAAEVRRNRRVASAGHPADWAPLLFVMTDGKPSDVGLYGEQCPVIRDLGFAARIGCVAGPRARTDDLKPLCDHIVSLDTLDATAFAAFFQWVSAAIAGGSRSVGAGGTRPLPPPPPEIQMVY